MAKAASSDKLRKGFEEHLEQTRGHVPRLEQISNALDESPKGKKSKGMEGLIEEGSEVTEEVYEGAFVRCGIDWRCPAGGALVEHYEMAGYGTAKSFAEELGESKPVCLLQSTLAEEKATDEKLTQLSKEINKQANSGVQSEQKSRRQNA